jgi:RNA polymerase sigma factor (sigma-70 family)
MALQSFHQLYTDYRKDVFYFLLRLSGYEQELAEELTQETFYQAIRSFATFRGECHVKTWLLQIAKNVFYQEVRKKQRGRSLLRSILFHLEKSEPEALHKQVENKEKLAAVLKILDAFDSRTRDVMLYRFYSDLGYAQISAMLNISESSAKVIFFRGKHALQSKLREGYGYEI